MEERQGSKVFAEQERRKGKVCVEQGTQRKGIQVLEGVALYAPYRVLLTLCMDVLKDAATATPLHHYSGKRYFDIALLSLPARSSL